MPVGEPEFLRLSCFREFFQGLTTTRNFPRDSICEVLGGGYSMKQLLFSLAFVLVLPGHLLVLAANDSQSLPIVNIKKLVTIENIAKEAYLWGYPLVRFERTRKLMTTTPGYGHAPLNNFFHAERAPVPEDRQTSNPLPDTLYSSAFLDLREQPLVLQIPRIKDRYYNLQFFNAFNDNFYIISSRNRGDTAGKFFITGPRYIGATPAGFERISANTNYVWLIGRIAAVSPADAKKSYRLIRKYELKPYNVYLGKQKKEKMLALAGKFDPAEDPRRIASSGIGFFDELGQALRENGPTNLNVATMNRFRSAEIGSGIKTSRNTMTRETRDSYIRAVAAAELEMDKAVKTLLVKSRNGWNYILPSSNLNSNETVRAALSKVYFAQPQPLESLHPVAYSDTGNLRLNGNFTYILRFEKNRLPPIGAMWSVVPYDSRLQNLIANNLKRYSLGSYSPNLLYNADGSLDLYLSANEPRGKVQNWLPVPRGNFYVMMNMYNPTNDVIQGKYVLPRLQRASLLPVISLNK